jgi:hypothetical protein
MIGVPIDAYYRLRPRSLKQRRDDASKPLVPIGPDLVGRTNPRNVVIGVPDRARSSTARTRTSSTIGRTTCRAR